MPVKISINQPLNWEQAEALRQVAIIITPILINLKVPRLRISAERIGGRDLLGRYFHAINLVTLDLHKIGVNDILDVVLHELAHHIQRHDKNCGRCKSTSSSHGYYFRKAVKAIEKECHRLDIEHGFLGHWG